MFFFYFTIYDHHVQGYLTNQVIERISINRKFLLGHATSTSCPNTSQQNDYSRENECLRAHPYTCGICLFKFTNRYNLTIHIRRKHTKEKPFKCTYCARGFAAQSDLTIHVRIHTGENPYSCNMCGKRFKSNSTLRKHSRRCRYIVR